MSKKRDNGVYWHTLFTCAPVVVLLVYGYPLTAFTASLVLSGIIIIRERLQKQRTWYDLLDREQVFYEWSIPTLLSLFLSLEGVLHNA